MTLRLRSVGERIERVRQGVREIWLSVSAMGDFRKCPRYYFLHRIKRLEKREVHLPFIVGRIANVGIHHILAGKPWEHVVHDAYQEEIRKIKKYKLVMDPEDQEDLKEQQYVIPGMMKAYAARYARNLKDTVHIYNEKPFLLRLSEVAVTLIGKIDNVIQRRKKRYLHELKTSKKITDDYVESVQTDFQTGIYWYANQELVSRGDVQGMKLDGILYDVIRKPSIRQKKKETYQEFLVRLKGWYGETAGERNFHAETLHGPKLKKGDVFNSVMRIAEDIRRAKESKDQMSVFYQDFGQCHRYGRCQFYEICHDGGLTRRNLLLYRTKESTRVEDELEGNEMRVGR